MKTLSKDHLKKACVLAFFSSLLVSSLTHSIPDYQTVAEQKNPMTNAVTWDGNSITAGANFSAIVKDGDVLVFGDNEKGQLGLGDSDQRLTPTLIPYDSFNNEKVVKAVASGYNLITLTEKGKVYITGMGGFGNTPVLAYESSDIIDIEANSYNTVGRYPVFFLLMKDGTVRVAGQNYNGSFGNGLRRYGGLGNCEESFVSPNDFSHQVLKSATYETCSNNSSWKKIVTSTPLTGVKKISANPLGDKQLALTNNNEIYYWGTNSKYIPTKLSGSTSYNIVDVVFAQYPVFLTEEGLVYYYPSLSGTPTQITLEGTSAKAVKIEAADNNLLILTSDGKLYGLGVNTYGSLGPDIDESGIDYSSKTAGYTGVSNVEDFAMGVEHTIVRYKNGNYYAFGRNAYGELGSEEQNSKSVFTKNPNLKDVAFVHATFKNSYASTTDNKYYSWGGPEPEQLLGRTGPSNVPGFVKDFSSYGTIVSLDGYSDQRSSGGVMLSNGTYWNFDYKYYNSTGNPDIESYRFNEVKNFNSAIQGPTKILSGAQGNFSGTVVGDDGKLYSWGYDKNNLLGIGYDVTTIVNGASVPSGLPSYQEVVIPDGVTFKKVYAGYYARLALTDKNEVYAWGYNWSSRFGIKNNLNIKVPTKVTALPPIKDIAIGRWHTLFLDFDGNVWVSGQGLYGALGVGDTKNRTTPVKIPTLKNVAKIFAGDYDSYALLETGELYVWGRNQTGALGLGDKIQRNEPRLVSYISDVKDISSGFSHTLLATNSGDLYVTGSDGEFQLGLGSTQDNRNPIPIRFAPILTTNNTDNAIYETTDTVTVNGTLSPLVKGYDVELSYSLESKNGTSTTPLKTVMGVSDDVPFSFNINLSDFSTGAYTIIIKAVSSNNTQSTYAINFSVVDETAPTVSLEPSKTENAFSLEPLTVTAKIKDQGGSGYEGYKYAVTNSNQKPTTWSDLQTAPTAEWLLNQTGAHYIHIEAFDSAGNSTYKVGGPYHIELYEAQLGAVSQINKNELKWEHSLFGSEFQLTRDNELLYTGSATTYTDVTQPGTTHTYRLYLWTGEEFALVDTLEKKSGTLAKEFPTSIRFPTLALGSQSSILPTSMDKEYLKIEDHSDILTAYSVNVSVTDLTSANGNSLSPTWVWRGLKKLNSSNSILKEYDDILLSDTPVELISASETSIHPYTHIELPYNGLELFIPTDIYLANGAETFTATMYWDITLAP